MDKSLTPIFLFAAAALLTAARAPGWALKRPTLVGLLTAAVAAWGVIAWKQLPVEMMPNVASSVVTVTVSVRGGMAPTDVEALIIRPLEDVLGDLPRLKTLFTSAKKDRGVVSLEFHPGADMRRATAETHERVDRVVGRLPPEIEKPVIAHFEENDAPVAIIAVTPRRLSPEAVRKLMDERVKDRLLRVPGVASVELGGGREGKILVELDRDRMAAHNLSAHQITRLLSRRNISTQVGTVTGERRQTAVRVLGGFRTVEEMRRLPVARGPEGGQVFLGQIAQVTDGYLDPESLSRLNGRSAVTLYVMKESGANTVEAVAGLRTALEEAWRELPASAREDLTRFEVSNQAAAILASMASVRVSLICGILLILIALCFFESARPSSRRLAAGFLGMLSLLAFAGAWLQVSDARMEPAFLALLGLFGLLALNDPDLRPGFIVAASMPLSGLVGILLFQACGISLNAMSLFGLALGLGMLVDNATVVFEHVTAQGPPPPGVSRTDWALKASREMVLPLIGGTVTNAVVFVPFLFLSPDVRLLYNDVAAAVAASLFASLTISLTAVPLLAVHVARTGPPLLALDRLAVARGLPLERIRLGFSRLSAMARRNALTLWARLHPVLARAGEGLGTAAGRLLRWLTLHDLGSPGWGLLFALLFLALWVTGWTGAARWLFFLLSAVLVGMGLAGLRGYGERWPGLMARRGRVLGAALGLGVLSAAIVFWGTDRDFQAQGELDEFVVFVELSSGVQLSVSNAVMAEIEERVRSHPGVGPAVRSLVSRVEGWSSRLYVTLVPRADRRLTTEQVQDILRAELKGAGRDRDPQAFVHFSSPRSGQEIAVNIYGPEDPVREDLAQRVSAGMERSRGFSDVKLRYRPGRPEVRAVLDPDRAADLGFTAESAAETAHALLRGLRATVFRAGGSQTETIVRLRSLDRRTLESVADVPLAAADRRSARLGDLADLQMGTMPNDIHRENKERLIQVTANRAGLPLGRAALEVQAVLDSIDFPLEYHARLADDVEDMVRSFRQLVFGIAVMVVLVYLVLVTLFESVRQPLIVLTTVPLALAGVAGGLILFRLPVSTGVLVGILMLAGVVVNNAILLMDRLNQEPPGPLADRLRRAVEARTRPILLTAGTAVLGFLPMMLDGSEAGALWRPLAVTMVFGLLSSTVLTLYVTPCLTHLLLGDLPRLAARLTPSRDRRGSHPLGIDSPA